MLKKTSTLLLILVSMHLYGDVINIQGATNITTTSSQVNAIVVDGNGNMSQQVFPYNPQSQQVDVGSADQGENASIYLTLFMMGFMWWDGYWVGHNGYYWNGHTNVYVKNVNWNNHWNNYWHNTWNNKWNNYYNTHKNDPGFHYKNNRSWPHHAGQFPGHGPSHPHDPPHFQREDHNFQRHRENRNFHRDH